MTPGMPARACLRRYALLLALLLGACASEPPPAPAFPPLDFSYLPPLALNVARLEVQSHYVASGVPPDISQDDPASPVDALGLMAAERLRPVGSAGRAVFVIDDAAVRREDDSVAGRFSVTLNVYTSAGVRAGFAQATAIRRLPIDGQDLSAALYTLTRQLMQQMNVEFEFQMRRSLRDWLVSAGTPPPPPAPAATTPPPPYALPQSGAPPEPTAAPPSLYPPPPAPATVSPPAVASPLLVAPPPASPSPLPAPKKLPPLGPVQD